MKKKAMVWTTGMALFLAAEFFLAPPGLASTIGLTTFVTIDSVPQPSPGTRRFGRCARSGRACVDEVAHRHTRRR